jgi:hypothetical protein
MDIFKVILVTAAMCVICAAGAFADVPNQFNFQGTLADTNGSPITGTRNMQFSLYEDSVGGLPLWDEIHMAVEVVDGLFRVRLGSGIPLPPSVFVGGVMWLGIQVDPDPTELTPRQPLVSVPYGLRANPDDDWGVSGINVYRLDGYVGIGTSTPSSGYLAPLLHLQHSDHGGIVIERTNPPAGKWQIGTGGSNTGSLDFARLAAGNYIYMTIETDGDVGIGMIHPDHKLDVGGDVNTSSHYKIDGTTVLSVDGTECVLVGKHAGENNIGGNVTFLGDSAGFDNEGWYNTFLGYQSGRSNSTGYGNSFIGAGAGMSNTSGIYGTFVGAGAGSSNGDGAYNTYIGRSAGVQNSGGWNVFLGASTGYHNHFGSHNVFLGYNAGFYESGSNKLYIANAADTDNVLIYGDFEDRHLGIGTVTTVNTLSVGGGTSIGSGYTSYTAPTDGMIVQGNMGVGSAFPSHKMTVSSLTDDVLRLIGPDGAHGYGARLNFGDGDYVYLDEDTDDNLTINANRTAITGGFVGIGTNNPTQILHLYSSFNPRLLIEAPSSQVPEVNLRRGTTTHAMYVNSGNDLVFYRAGDRVTFTDAGDVGIGTISPAYKLDVAGPCHASSFPTSSDERLKTDIQELDNVLDKLKHVRGVSFDWNGTYESLGRSTGHREIGVIAQEMEAQFPELVTTWGDENYRAVDYGRLSAVLIEAVKELQVKNSELESRIAELESFGRH